MKCFQIAVSRRKALAKEGRGWGNSDRKHLPTYPGEGGGKLRRLRWFPPPFPKVLWIESKTLKVFDVQSFSKQPKKFRGRGERTISNAEVPFPPPQRKQLLAKRRGCPNPSISLAGPPQQTDKPKFPSSFIFFFKPIENPKKMVYNTSIEKF